MQISKGITVTQCVYNINFILQERMEIFNSSTFTTTEIHFVLKFINLSSSNNKVQIIDVEHTIEYRSGNIKTNKHETKIKTTNLKKLQKNLLMHLMHLCGSNIREGIWH